MPAAEEQPRRRRSPPAGLSADTLYLGEKLDAVEERVARLEAKAPSPKMLIAGALSAVLLVFGIQAATTVYLISGLLATRGVDVTEAADATKKVVGAGADVAQEP